MSAWKQVAQRAVQWSGGIRLARHMSRQGLRILTYHRFGDPGGAWEKALQQQCVHFRRYYHPVSLTEAAAMLRSARPLPPRSLVITIDDGYRDCLPACRLFRSFGIPVTVYVATDFLDGLTWLWTDVARWAFQQTSVAEWEYRGPSGPVRFSLVSPALRRLAQFQIIETLKLASNAERLQWIRELPRQLGVSLPPQPPPDLAPLSWEEVGSLAGQGVEFGAHTRSHPILSRLAGETELRHEVDGSRARIEQEIGRPVLHFCYPNGRPQDLSPLAVEVVRRAGFQTAVTTAPGLNYRGADSLLLKRLGVEPDLSPFDFQTVLTGLRR